MQDVVDRVPNLGSKGAYLKQQMQDKLIEHKHYIDKHGQDLPEIRNWKWGQGETQKRETAGSKDTCPGTKVAADHQRAKMENITA